MVFTNVNIEIGPQFCAGFGVKLLKKQFSQHHGAYGVLSRSQDKERAGIPQQIPVGLMEAVLEALRQLEIIGAVDLRTAGEVVLIAHVLYLQVVRTAAHRHCRNVLPA